MSKFITGFAAGTFTGWLFHDRISRVLHNVIGVAQEKVEETEETSAEASFAYPANGVNLSSERKREINISTIERPIVLTLEDIKAMDIDLVHAHIDSGRFQLPESMRP